MKKTDICLSNQTSKIKFHSYTAIKKVGNGNFGQAILVESSINGNRYIMKVISKAILEN
jgi:hypothetical protein